VKKRLIDKTTFSLVNYIIGPTLGMLICLLEAFGRIKILWFDRFPIFQGKLIIVSNHPSLLEPWVIPLIGFPWMNFPWLFSPLWFKIRLSLSWFRELRKEFSLPRKLIPANVPDKDNFYDPSHLRLFRVINVPVDRKGGMQSRTITVLGIKRVLENGGRVLIFPEGTRTFKAVDKSKISSAKGKKLGRLKDGAGWLALKTGAKILPIWVDGTDKVLPNNKWPFPRVWHQITIKIGNVFSVHEYTRQEATTRITQSLLELADEEVSVKLPATSTTRDKTTGLVPDWWIGSLP